MAAQYITLDEAAKRLGIPAEEFKRRLKTEWTHLVPMRDGPTLRFRENQIEELGRQLGAASDPELPLAPIAESADPESEEFKVQSKKKGKGDEPLVFDSAATDDDIFSLSADAPKPAKSSGDSSSGDSDVRLEVSKMPKDKRGSREPEAIPTEEIALEPPGSAVIKGGSSAKLTPPKSSGKLMAGGSEVSKALSSKSSTGDSSEFELSLDADSDDFELQLNTDSSDEVDLGSSPVDTGSRSGKSGINLKAPGDSGVSLEKGKKGDSGKGMKKTPKPETDSDSDVDFELSLEAEPSHSGSKLGKGIKGGKIPDTSDSDSEFELTLDDSGEGSSLEAAAMEGEESKGDIFETDFEIPPMSDESGSEAVAIDSDTDIESDVAIEEDSDLVAEEETGSQVVVLEDEEEAAPAKGRGRKQAAVAEEGDVDLADEEHEESAASALKGVKSRRLMDEDEVEIAASGRAAPKPWGPLPAIILFPAFIIILLGGLMGVELVGTMMGYQQPSKPGAPLVRGMAKTFDMELKDQ